MQTNEDLKHILFKASDSIQLFGLTGFENEIMQQCGFYNYLTWLDLDRSDGKAGNLFRKWLAATTYRKVYENGNFEFHWSETIATEMTTYRKSCVRNDEILYIHTTYLELVPMEGRRICETLETFDKNGLIKEREERYTDRSTLTKRYYRNHPIFTSVEEIAVDSFGETTIKRDNITEMEINENTKRYTFTTDRECTSPIIECYMSVSTSGTHYQYQPAGNPPYYESRDHRGNIIEQVSVKGVTRKNYVMPDKTIHLKRAVTNNCILTWFYELNDDEQVVAVSYKIKETKTPRIVSNNLIVLNKIL